MPQCPTPSEITFTLTPASWLISEFSRRRTELVIDWWPTMAHLVALLCIIFVCFAEITRKYAGASLELLQWGCWVLKCRLILRMILPTVFSKIWDCIYILCILALPKWLVFKAITRNVLHVLLQKLQKVRAQSVKICHFDTDIVKNRDNFVVHAHALVHSVRRGVQGPAYGPRPPEAVDILSIGTAKNCLSANI